jgi:adenylylsulfate kinase
MIQPSSATQSPEEAVSRSLVKTISYRLLILVLDFSTIYLFTRKVKIALGFMVASNVYTTIAYFFHERIWGRIKWGKHVVKNDRDGLYNSKYEGSP